LVYANRAEYVNVKEDPKKLDEMLLLTRGIRKVPVIVEGEQITIGYGGS
jgi:glutaredoxin